MSFEVTQTDNNHSVPWQFVRDLSQHHTTVYMDRLLQLADPTLAPAPVPPATSSANLAEEVQSSADSTSAAENNLETTEVEILLETAELSENSFVAAAAETGTCIVS